MEIVDKITILTKAEIGEDRFINQSEENIKNQLDVLYKYGSKCAISDGCIVTGGKIGGNDIIIQGNACSYFLQDNEENSPYVVLENGAVASKLMSDKDYVIRPVFKDPSFFDGLEITKHDRLYGINVTTYGEYFSSSVSDNRQNLLEKAYFLGNLSKTNKSYHVYNNGELIEYPEYSFNGQKYVRMQVVGRNNVKLSNGLVYQEGDYVWLNVEPIKWLIDEEKRTLVCLDGALAGVKFSKEMDYDGDFSKTFMYEFMNEYMIKDFAPSKILDDTLVDEEELKFFDDLTKVTEEDIIRGAIESDIPVFLHGESGDGKSSRIKAIDPDCEIIYLSNASYDSLLGKSVYDSNTGEMIDVKPTWLLNLERKCMEEPDRIHILFFDELSNAAPSNQDKAFNIILDKEVNGKWKLPKNVRIAGAGNEKEESKASRGLTEPMFNRFAHVYIKTTVFDWLMWASTPKEEAKPLGYSDEAFKYKVHPLIFSYINYSALIGKDVLRSKFDGKRPNANPRKWEMASNILEKTNNPYMLRALVGEDITNDFVEFTKKALISVDDVINKKYSDEVFRMDKSHKYATIARLSEVDEEYYMIVREFVLKLGDDVCATFDAMWASGIESRLDMVMLAKMEEKKGMSL